ncbi:hypothetical protein [Kribbella sp.]|uniref:type II toxin-antitoxin system HicB family antitoxin n=1 Tax=Kribbella sp. TaxID=1871183 RepID=UPI002D5D55B2|nr:hypothetical protein [Kribbella sp.]HZX01393.1 hypothetical protein [Kribbella sp.]
MKTYEVTVRRDGRWWMVGVPELDGVTQARRLDEVERMAREYIAVSTDVPLSKVAVEVVGIEAGGRDLLEAKTLVEALRRRAKDLEALVAELTRQVASALTDVDVPVRDVSSVLGVSHQRVSQLAQSAVGDDGAPTAQAVRQARREFAHDLVVDLGDGRSVQLVEVRTAKSARAKKAIAGQRTRRNADRTVRRTAAPRKRRGRAPLGQAG